MAKLVTLTNDFHNSRVTLRLDVETPYTDFPDYQIALLTPGQVRKARKALCGSPDCRCAQNSAGTRGRQYATGKPLQVHCPQLP